MKHSITLRSLVSGFLMTAIVSLGLFSAPVAEASCWMGATGPVYVNTITGLDKGGKWGCDPAKPMKTVQGAIDKYVASYSGAWGPFTILVTDARGSGVISVDNSGNAPIVIEPWTASSLNTVFEVEGQNVEITGWVFNSGAGIETTDEIDFLSVYGNHFHAGSYVDLSAGSDHQIEIRSNDFDGADVSASTTDGWFSIYQNNFYGAASGSDVYIAMVI